MPFITFSDVSTCSIVLSTVLRYRLCSGSFYIPLSWATFNLFYCLVIVLKLYKRLVHLFVRFSIWWFFIGLWWSNQKVLKHALPLLPTSCIWRQKETNRAVALCLRQGQNDLTFNDIKNKLTWYVSTLTLLYVGVQTKTKFRFQTLFYNYIINQILTLWIRFIVL